MSLVFSAIVPHPPILIPNIGKDNLDKLEKTKSAMEKLEQELYSSKPDIIFIISPHGQLSPDYFTVNLSDKFTVDFEDFGNFSDQLKFKGEMVLFTVNKEKIAENNKLNIISESKLDHGIGVPLFYLMKHLSEVPIVPIYFSMLDNQAHYEFGKSLKDLILRTEKRVAVLASADLSHCLTTESPAPYNPDGKIFDEKLIKIIENCDSLSLVNLDSKLIENAEECGLRSILILSGIIGDMNCQPEILSYEYPFGIGYLVANIKLI
jgi:MEMO1 family protein